MIGQTFTLTGRPKDPKEAARAAEAAARDGDRTGRAPPDFR
jgi:hypothetical protein